MSKATESEFVLRSTEFVNKKIKGRKRQIAVDIEGNMMAAGATAASVHDKTEATVLKDDIEYLERVRKIIADSAYRGVSPFTVRRRIEWQIIEKKATGGRFKVLRKRWIVERTFSCLETSADWLKIIK